jgi:predicted NUDIX family NTP pyrophosphohydrolase
MAERSAGLLVFRRMAGGGIEFLLAHPGGPWWARKDAGAWTVPKGLIGEGEESHAAALREFEEETGQAVDGDFVELQPLKQKSGKLIFCWLVEAQPDMTGFRSNLFEMEWPPKSGLTQRFPEIDRVGWFDPQMALEKILPGQAGFVREALERLGQALPA